VWIDITTAQQRRKATCGIWLVVAGTHTDSLIITVQGTRSLKMVAKDLHNNDSKLYLRVDEYSNVNQECKPTSRHGNPASPSPLPLVRPLLASATAAPFLSCRHSRTPATPVAVDRAAAASDGP